MEKYIAAYGSNLYEQRMKTRCPSAVAVGTSTINRYRLLFKQSVTGAYATIEQDANCYVPVVIYRVSPEDERRLDRYEGYPDIYYKQGFLLPVRYGKKKLCMTRVQCTAYIMREHRLLGEPSEDYFRLIETGYERWGFDPLVLYKALDDSIGKDAAPLWLSKYFYKGAKIS